MVGMITMRNSVLDVASCNKWLIAFTSACLFFNGPTRNNKIRKKASGIATEIMVCSSETVFTTSSIGSLASASELTPPIPELFLRFPTDIGSKTKPSIRQIAPKTIDLFIDSHIALSNFTRCSIAGWVAYKASRWVLVGSTKNKWETASFTCMLPLLVPPIFSNADAKPSG